ncbi:WXG100 family type VII secretion target [Streptomyces lavenduligriseus]|uniref:PPE family domain-containing protein n=1 Tax=Streptomyces lavenduligriseus TaxID=67315 RepID=A0ABT0P0G2_9ACTN|nr:hypothetical protein [Streptomyces lavenduligriseus]MCL3997088.1 hypothetical protein [Streptomyces lavenduligriseus]
MPTYHEIMTTDLSALTTAAEQWDGMAKEFHQQETAYQRDVCGITLGPGWSGLSADAANGRFNRTLQQFKAAQVEAKAIASLLREAHTDFVSARKKLESAREDAVKAGMAVSEGGVVSYDTTKLNEGERAALHHDPDYQQSVHKAVASWQAEIDRLVKDISDTDAEVDNALTRVVIDSDVSDGTLVGFNGRAHGDIKTYEDEAKREAARTEPDGWKSEGKTEASGPGVGASAKGPDYRSGKLGEAEAHADLGSASAEGSLTRGPWKLDGKAEVYAGVKGSASGGVSQNGVEGDAGAFAGGEGSAEGSAGVGPVSVSAKAEAAVGAEANANAGVGKEGVHVGGEAFAGAKGGGEVGADIGGVSAGFSAEGWAGPGAEANLDFGRNNQGVWKLSTKVGISPALGGSVGLDFSVDPGKVVDTAGDLAGAVGHGVSSFGHAVASVF